MWVKRLLLAALAVAVIAPVAWIEKAQAAGEQFIPLLVYRTGPYAPNGIPSANGYIDYMKLLNARDGGINGVTVTWEECEYRYDTKLGVECYERLKNKGAK
ncbi:MAG TPA: ABC transporter permease, partial [Alphaproteobacteria bacterium]|nr:ABC transporter permease [Alphaproteobacteria bacterium]